MEISEGIVLSAIAVTFLVTAAAALLWLSGVLYQSDAARTWSDGREALRRWQGWLWDKMRISVKWFTGALQRLVGHWTPHHWGVVVGLTFVLLIATAADLFLMENYFSDRLQQRRIIHITAALAVLGITVLPGIVLDAGGFSVYRRLTQGTQDAEPAAKRSTPTLVLGVLFQVLVVIGILFLADDRVTLLHNPELHPDSGEAVGTERLAWILLFAALAIALSLLHGVAYDLVNLVQGGFIVAPIVMLGAAVSILSLIGWLIWIAMAALGWVFTLLANIAQSIGFTKRWGSD